MKKVGITGQAGFVGRHLFNFLKLKKNIELIPFEDDFFYDESTLRKFVRQCDVIVHLAAMNRHNDPQILYNKNVELVLRLINAMDQTNVRPHVIFASSTQEDLDNPYGRSKKEGRKLLSTWANENGAKFTGLIIPNIFGPFGQPYYNSVVATFSHQLTHGEKPKILSDKEINLLYVGNLVRKIYEIIEAEKEEAVLRLSFDKKIYVSEILEKLVEYKTTYFQNGILPDLKDNFDINLFNTFRCYIDLDKFFPYNLKINRDERGAFVEVTKTNIGGQFSFSSTKPGITRGNHFHTRKIERFIVIKGKAKIEMRRIGTEKVFSFELDGENPSFVDMPIWYTHNITNIGEETLYTLFWINEFYDPNDPDTFFEKV